MPANSDTTSPTLATTSAPTAKVARRNGNCSRMSDMRPSPV